MKKQLFAALVMIMTVGMVYAQPAGRGQGGARPGGGAPRGVGGADESLVVNINTMDVQTRNRITEAADKIKALVRKIYNTDVGIYRTKRKILCSRRCSCKRRKYS